LQLHAGLQGADNEVGSLMVFWGGTRDGGLDHGEFSCLKGAGFGFGFGGRCFLGSLGEDAVNDKRFV
jgi:hypothetical protein